MNMALLTCLWYAFNTLKFALEGGAFLYLPAMSQRSSKSQNHLHFELPKAKALSLKLVHDSRPFAIKICHLLLKRWGWSAQNLQNRMFSSQRDFMTLKSLK